MADWRLAGKDDPEPLIDEPRRNFVPLLGQFQSLVACELPDGPGLTRPLQPEERAEEKHEVAAVEEFPSGGVSQRGEIADLVPALVVSHFIDIRPELFRGGLGIQKHLHFPTIFRLAETVESTDPDPGRIHHDRGRTSLKNTPICSTTRSWSASVMS